MAQQLIEKWRLAVLRVHLDVTDPTPAVVTELVSYPDGTPHWLWTRRHAPAAFGLSDAAEQPHRLCVPDDLRDDIADSLERDLRGEASLWVRLAPPYGYLGAVPWEQAMLDVTNVPLLRVPDRLPVAPDPGRVWSVAIALSAPADTRWAVPYLTGFADRLGVECEPLVEVDVFTDAGTVAQLRQAAWQPPPWLHLHDPGQALPASQERADRLKGSPYQLPRRGYQQPRPRAPIDPRAPGRIWADWIAAGLGGRAVRALHVVLDATWDVDHPVLVLAPDPSQPPDPTTCMFLTGEDVVRLADSVGAATLSFGSPPDVASDEAMRVTADEVGQQRPGATLYSSIRDDDDGFVLATVHGFLAAAAAGDQGQRRPVPRHRSLFAYVQPEQVQASLAEAWPQPLPAHDPQPRSTQQQDPLPNATLPPGYHVSADADLTEFYATTDTVPSWVAASERYVGQQLADLSRSASGTEPDGYKQAYDRGAAEALAKVQDLIAKHARPS